MAHQAHRLTGTAPPDEARLRRFARLATPLLGGHAVQGVGPRSARDRAGAGLEFLDLRAYAPGEDIRHIDWRQSARRGRTLIRRYRDESAADWYLAVDGSASMALGRKWPFAVELGLGFAYALLQAGHRVSLLVFDDRVRVRVAAGRGSRQFATLVRELRRFEPLPRGGASLPGVCTAHMRRSGNLMLISDLLREDAMAADLRRLRASVAGAEVIQVLARDEADPAAVGPALLRDVESGERRPLTLSPATIVAARERLDRHGERLRAITVGLGMRFSRCRDDGDWERTLLTHLGA
ncbi:DUF58 domain-containing protein [Lentisalinibacter salinarum]|uniref:DUF58 domain-containing protein n=1 Tax=Lentisalinibacter salinarum TaxID=2992239 RepID=UPI0038655C55